MSDNSKDVSLVFEQAANRNKVIVKTGIIGIIVNVLLAGFKALVGSLAHSISIILDAVNNLTDAISSVVTIIGAKFSAKRPDKKHPLGHGRAEYLSTMVIAALVLYAGIAALVESVKKIIHPEKPDYTAITLVVIGVAVFVKIFLGLYFKKRGKAVDSGSLIASGSDALFDAVISVSVLAAAVVYLTAGVSLEAYLGVIISAFIIKSGIEMMLETFDEILGKRSDPELTKKIKALVSAQPGVRGAYDLIITNYGPGKNYASLHIEVPDTATANEIDLITRGISEKVYTEMGIILTAVGIYSYNTGNDEAAEARDKITETVLAHEWAIQIHGFFIDFEKKDIRFDVVLSFDVEHSDALEVIHREIGELYPGFRIVIAPDVDLSDV